MSLDKILETVDAGLDASLIRGRVLLNLDSEEDGNLCVGCAGPSRRWGRSSIR